MLKNKPNIYLTARKCAGMTRIQAHIKLAISETCLKDYELGIRMPPDEMAVRMAKVYGTPWLCVQHLRGNIVMQYLLAGDLDVDLKQETEAMGILRMQKELGEVMEGIPGMIKRSLAGVVLASDALKDIKEAAIALLNILGIKKDPASVGSLTGTIKNSTKQF